MAAILEFQPPPPLAGLVEAFWCYWPVPNGVSPPPSLVRVTPDGYTDLIAVLKLGGGGAKAEPSGLAVCGPTDRLRLVDLTPNAAWVGVRFKFGTARQLFGVTPADLFRQECDASALDPSYSALADRLCDVTSASQTLDVVRSFLLESASRHLAHRPPLRPQAALNLLGRNFGPSCVHEVARSLGVSERTVHRDILSVTGLPPKTLARIFRVRAAVAHLRKTTRSDLCELAVLCGYADQSHLTREFQEFVGQPPARFMGSARTGELHV